MAAGSISPEASGIVGILLAHGAEPNVQDGSGRTALMHAASFNQPAVIKQLAENGADLNLRDSKGLTALVIAKERKESAQAYELLKSLGAKEQ